MVFLMHLAFALFVLWGRISLWLKLLSSDYCMKFIRLFSWQGYTHPREYIVTEWPLPNTCSDIWSLVYDHDCSAVVVLCNPTSTVSNVSNDWYSLSHNLHCKKLLRVVFATQFYPKPQNWLLANFCKTEKPVLMQSKPGFEKCLKMEISHHC